MQVASLDPQGPVAAEIAELWWGLAFLGGSIFVVFVALLIRGLTRPERGRVSERSDRKWVVGGGVVMPLIVITVVFGITVAAMRALPVAGSQSMTTVEITGRQWWWDVVYAEQGIRTANELVLPVGVEVELRLRSADVVHSFWVPALAGKMDLLPDGTTTMVISGDELGTYRGACAEFCGLQHAKMGFVARVVTDTEFAAWITAQTRVPNEPSDDPTAEGRQVFLEAGCGKCHRIEGTADGLGGPDLTHLASRLTLAAGTFPNTPAHLRDWVSHPQQHKEGVAMEDTALSAASLDALVAYLGSLE